MYMVMEYCEGGDLFKTMLMHGGALEEQWVCVEVGAFRLSNRDSCFCNQATHQLAGCMQTVCSKAACARHMHAAAWTA